MRYDGLYPWPWKAALCLCAVSLFLLGRQLDFSGWVHPDEPNKVSQIIKDSYNLNHPLLMLRSVKIYADSTGISDDYNRIILAGRWSSVIFSSLAVAFLVLVIGRLHGPVCGSAAGLFVLCTPLFYELAHYFKEDPCLLFGLSLSLLAMQVYSERPSFGTVAILGAACGVAASGKYAGLMILPFAAYSIIAARRKGDLLAFVLSAVGTFCLINWPMITSPEVWKSRVDLEVSRLQAEGVPNRRRIPHGACLSTVKKHASPFLFGILVVYAWSVWRRKFHLHQAEWTIVLMPTLYVLTMSFIPTTSERYMLPASVLLACAAAAGLAPLLRWRHGKIAAVLVCAAAVVWQIPKLIAEDAAFSSRRHSEVVEFIRSELPPSSVVLVDNYNSLDPANYSEPQIRQRRLQPGETLESLRQRGFTHVLVTAKRYLVFRPDSRRASGMSAEETGNMRALYGDIFNRCRLIFEWKAGNKELLEPEFRLYQLPG